MKSILLVILIAILVVFLSYSWFRAGKERGILEGKELGHYEVLQKKVIYELQQQPDSTVIWVRMK